MTLAEIHRFFKDRKLKGRIITHRSKHMVLFKMEKRDIMWAPLELEEYRPPMIDFVFKPLNLWDRLRMGKHALRMEFR